ncbi:MAG: fibronectin type III domain-containing protein [Verrucomicrobiales bacterium]|nr:fibronectin type III domain-containing protein [Verrucomicrobiales bacterium]
MHALPYPRTTSPTPNSVTRPGWMRRQPPRAKGSGRLCLILFAGLIAAGTASSAALLPVTLAWDSPSWVVEGYTIHYGTTSRLYTKETEVGNVTTAVLNGLVEGTRYYVAVTAYGEDGSQSEFSNEIQFVLGLPILRIESTPDNQIVVTVKGKPGESYAIEATQSFLDWSVIGTASLDANGFMNHLDDQSTLHPNRFYRARPLVP